jgi:hypothetical protein
MSKPKRHPTALSPSLTQDLRGAVTPGRTTWRETSEASVVGAIAVFGAALVAAGWLRSRAQHR